MTWLTDPAGLARAGLPGLLSAVAFALSALLVTRALKPAGPIDAILFFFPVLCAHVLATGYALSALNALNSTAAWALAAWALCALSCVAAWLGKNRLRRLAPHRPRRSCADGNPGRATLWIPAFAGMTAGVKEFPAAAMRAYGRLTPGEKRLLVPMLFTALVLALVNFDLVRNTAPHNWDSMTYHLARMAYYLQHGNLAYFDANYWAQVVHPKNSTLLTLYTYLASGRNENLTQLVQFVSYGVAAVAVYGICRRLGRDRYASLFAALVYALLIECLMEALTTQNDMLLTALFGAVTYALLAFRPGRQRRYLAVAGLSAGIAIGVKSSALLVGPSLAVVAAYALIPQDMFAAFTSQLARRLRRNRTGIHALGIVSGSQSATSASASMSSELRGPWVATGIRCVIADSLLLCAAVGAAACAFVLPAGYVENWQLYGNAIGPESVRKLHAFEGEPLAYVLDNGTRNLLRFGFEFVSFDGLPPGGIFADAHAWVRRAPRQLMQSLGIDLETTVATRAPFQYDKAPSSHEDASYWGVFGFALVLPIVLLALLGVIRAPGNWPLSVAALLFVLAEAYSGPYDPWRGRYFIIMAVFAVPVIACCVRPPGRTAFLPWRLYLAAVVLLGCLSALTGVLGRWNSAPEDVYTMDRLQQLTRNRPAYYEPILRFEQDVPADAMVAVALGEDSFEYPLFGAGLTRKLIPVNSFLKGPQSIPPQAEYFLYSDSVYNDRKFTDISLGEDWHLRILKPQSTP